MTYSEERKTHSCHHFIIKLSPELVEGFQHRGFVQGNVIRLVAFDFVQRLIRAGVVNVAFVVNVASMHFHDFSAHAPGF